MSVDPLPGRARSRVAAGALALYVLLAVACTWPLARDLGRPVTIQPDAFQNQWNAWWMGQALERGVSPWWTDAFFHPRGISLARHTLSPLNALAGAALLPALGPTGQHGLLLLLHVALGGWTAFLAARALSGSTGGALLAGVVFSLAPFHWFHLAQLNVASLAFLPLAVWAAVRVWQRPGLAPALGLAGSILGLAATSSYYLVDALIVLALVPLAGRLLPGDTRLGEGLVRWGRALLLAAAAVALVRWPLLAELLSGGGENAVLAEEGVQAGRSNDLLGYNLVGPPEHVTVSWPTLFGYGTLALLALGFRGWRRERFWLLCLGVFFVLGLGPELRVAGAETGVPLPYAVLPHLPVLSLLRKPDRAVVVVQLVLALLVAFAWRDVAARLAGERARRLLLGALLVAFPLELGAAPLRTFSWTVSPYFEELARDDTARAVVELPTRAGTFFDGRYLADQVVHGKPIAQGYTTSLALGPDDVRMARAWERAYEVLSTGDAGPLVEALGRYQVDVLVLRKSQWSFRAPLLPDGASVWQPFFLVRRPLVECRQFGLVPRPVPPAVLGRQAAALEAALGPPAYEDDGILVYRKAR